MNLRTVFGLPLLALFLLLQSCTELPVSVGVTVVNDSQVSRKGEMVSISASELQALLQLNDTAQFVILSPEGASVPYQFTYDGCVIFPANVAAGGKAVYTIQEGNPLPFESEVEGAVLGKRNQSIAWAGHDMAYVTPSANSVGENPSAALYALPSQAEISQLGREIDNQNGQEDAEGDSISESSAAGIDKLLTHVLQNGTARTGELSFVEKDSLRPLPGWQEYEILDNGPLRLTIKLQDATTEIGGHTLACTRIIVLDAGTPLNKMTLHFGSNMRPFRLAASLPLGEANSLSFAETESGLLAAADKTKSDDGKSVTTYRGCVFPLLPVKTGVKKKAHDVEPQKECDDYTFAVLESCPQTDLCYYFGATRDTKRFPTWESWIAYLARFAEASRAPLRTQMK